MKSRGKLWGIAALVLVVVVLGGGLLWQMAVRLSRPKQIGRAHV